ncbi:hypothetical protein E2C01_080817 [Portunus trituberculatus]|uniref:Uncharacterized protein n=1 Tax=Portunus trituberculatus TaxID=210409 RepID=A0A5B7IU65_PORTR|nr:hypothetical protein [Portunus trituberculatus]
MLSVSSPSVCISSLLTCLTYRHHSICHCLAFHYLSPVALTWLQSPYTNLMNDRFNENFEI